MLFQKYICIILFFSIYRLTSQLSIQPNIPSNLLLGQGIDGRKSSGNIVTPKASLNFPTKTLRTKSLLWTKPTGVAITSLSSTVKQVRNLSNFLLFFAFNFQWFSYGQKKIRIQKIAREMILMLHQNHNASS